MLQIFKKLIALFVNEDSYGVVLAVDVPKDSGDEVRLLEDYFSGLKIAKY